MDGVNTKLQPASPTSVVIRVFNSALFITGPKMRSEQPLIRVILHCPRITHEGSPTTTGMDSMRNLANMLHDTKGITTGDKI